VELHLQTDGIEERGRLTVNPIKPVALGLVAGQSHPCGERFRERLKPIGPGVVADRLGRPLMLETSSRACPSSWTTVAVRPGPNGNTMVARRADLGRRLWQHSDTSGQRSGRNPVIGYLEFVKTGEHRVAHEEMHKPQSSSDRCREPVERHRKQLAGVMASNALHREPAHYRPETCGLHV
jgi:hypothetical protein